MNVAFHVIPERRDLTLFPSLTFIRRFFRYSRVVAHADQLKSPAFFPNNNNNNSIIDKAFR